MINNHKLKVNYIKLQIKTYFIIRYISKNV